VGDAMPDFDDDHHGHGEHHGYQENQGYHRNHGYHEDHGYHGHHGHHGHHHGGADTDWWPVLPGLVVLLLLLAFLAHQYGYDRMLIEQWRAWIRPERAERAAWHAAVERHGRTAREFAAFECDPGAVLARPALADVTRPPTARFVDEFASACALRTDGFPGAAAAAEFTRAAERAERAWSAAVDAADRVGAACFAPGERKLLDQTIKLLTAAESTPHDGERHAAYRRALARLSELEHRTGWVLPGPAVGAVEHRARGMLVAVPAAAS
jgi:hypothetical protein